MVEIGNNGSKEESVYTIPIQYKITGMNMSLKGIKLTQRYTKKEK